MKLQTKKPMGRIVMLRLKDDDFELLHAAAVRHELSMSEIARAGLRAKAKSLLKRDRYTEIVNGNGAEGARLA